MNNASWSSFPYLQELQTEDKNKHCEENLYVRHFLLQDSSQEGKDLSFPVCAEDLQSLTWYQKFIWVAEKNPQPKLQ